MFLSFQKFKQLCNAEMVCVFMVVMLLLACGFMILGSVFIGVHTGFLMQ